MDLEGIIKLRNLGLKGPRCERVFYSKDELLDSDIDELYAESRYGLLTVKVYSADDVKKYARDANGKELLTKSSRFNFKSNVEKLILDYSLANGNSDMRFLVHESFYERNIAYTGFVVLSNIDSKTAYMGVFVNEGIKIRNPESYFRVVFPYNKQEVMFDEGKVMKGDNRFISSQLLRGLCEGVHRITPYISIERIGSYPTVKFIVDFPSEEIIYTDLTTIKNRPKEIYQFKELRAKVINEIHKRRAKENLRNNKRKNAEKFQKGSPEYFKALGYPLHSPVFRKKK